MDFKRQNAQQQSKPASDAPRYKHPVVETTAAKLSNPAVKPQLNTQQQNAVAPQQGQQKYRRHGDGSGPSTMDVRQMATAAYGGRYPFCIASLIQAQPGNRYYGPGVQLPSASLLAAASASLTTAAASTTLTKTSPSVNNEATAAAEASPLVPRLSRRSTVKEVAALQTRSMYAADKNAEALLELRENIPEISRIFDVHCRIGSGTFSSVLLGTLQRERPLAEKHRRRFAIKHHNPTNHPERILRELECMVKIGGTDYVIGINCCIRYNENVAFVMPYMSHDRFHDIYRSMTVAEIRDYLHKLLVALRHVHRFNVIHRDVKPSNILYNRRTRQFLLCDFGLAQHIAKDGSIVNASEISTTFLRMDAARFQDCGTNDTTMQCEDEAARAVAREQEGLVNNVRAAGGGGGVDYPVEVAPFKQSPPLAITVLTKKEQCAQKADTNRLVNRLRYVSCNVDPNNYVVSTKSLRKDMHASRAGTPGYRPPEVLLRYPLQNTSVDVWAVGVIMLSLLSSMHPFFKAPNDCGALSEIMNLFGDLVVRKTAFLLDRLVLLTQKINPLDLRRVCNRFRYSEHFLSPDIQRRYRRPDGSVDMCRCCEQPTFNCLCKHTNHRIEQYEGIDIFPLSAYDLLSRLLEVNPQKRITADEALKHPFFNDHHRFVPGIPINQTSRRQ